MSGASWDEGTVLAALTDAVVACDVRGRIVYANRAAAGLTGFSMLELIGRYGTDLVPQRWRDLFALSFQRVQTGDGLGPDPLRFPVLRADGTEVEVAAGVSVIDPPGGGGVLVIASLRDARTQRAWERHTHLLERLIALLPESPERGEWTRRVLDVVARAVRAEVATLWLTDAGSDTVQCEAFWSRTDDYWAFERHSRGIRRDVGERIQGRVVASGRPVEVDDMQTEADSPRGSAAVAAGLQSGIVVPLRTGDRVVGLLELFFRSQSGAARMDTATLVEMADEVAVVLERRLRDEHLAELLAREHDARGDAEAAHQRLEFLLAAGAHIASSLDDREVLDRLARLAVPMLGDLCIVDLLDEDASTIRRVLVAHSDAGVETAVGEVLLGSTFDLDGDHPVARVLRQNEPELCEELSDERLRDHLGDEEFGRALGVGSQVTVPLSSRGRTLGALSLLTMGSRGRYDKSDLPLAVELGRQAGLAIDNGRQYQRERTVVESLQRAFLPDRLPRIDGFELTARYLGGPAGEIGGDWYDAFPLGDGHVGLVIGDVGGHGLPAAATMGQLRNALRALALTGDEPATVCNRLDRHFHELEPGQFATLCFAVLHPASGLLRYATAGHVPGVLVSADGVSSFLKSTRGAPLGTHPLASTEQEEIVLPPGSTLLFYTDGLVEDRTNPITDGLDALAAAAVARVQRGLDLDGIADGVLVDRLAGVRRRDDVALLAMRRADAPE